VHFVLPTYFIRSTNETYVGIHDAFGRGRGVQTVMDRGSGGGGDGRCRDICRFLSGYVKPRKTTLA